MKAKITLIVLVCLMATSCTKWQWHDQNDNEDIELTESNYFFEGDLTKFALEIKIDSLENRAEFLKGQLGQNPDLEKEFVETVNLLNDTAALNNTILGSDAVFLKVPRGPIPVGPGPRVIPVDLMYVLMNEVSSLDVAIFNEKGEIVARTVGNIRTVPRTKGELQYRNISFEDPKFEGPVIVKITRVNEEGKETQIEIKAFKKVSN